MSTTMQQKTPFERKGSDRIYVLVRRLSVVGLRPSESGCSASPMRRVQQVGRAYCLCVSEGSRVAQGIQS